jgi:hypothetical protein
VWEFSEYNYCGGRTWSQKFSARRGNEQEIVLTPPEQQLKRRALKVYSSEKGNLGHVRTAAEAFRPLGDYDYSRPPHAGKLFYERFQWVPYHPRVDYTRPEEVCRALLAFQEGGRGTDSTSPSERR